jgi:hypothetical protein
MVVRVRSAISLAVSASLTACGFAGCEKYGSDYSCSYVEKEAEYEVWYWRNLGDDNEDDNRLIGKAVGLEMCQANAMLYAESIGEEWNDRAYICVLMEDGRRMEKHRL